MKDKLTAGLLAIFVGGLGIHKFYLAIPQKEYCIFVYAGRACREFLQ